MKKVIFTVWAAVAAALATQAQSNSLLLSQSGQGNSAPVSQQGTGTTGAITVAGDNNQSIFHLCSAGE